MKKSLFITATFVFGMMLYGCGSGGGSSTSNSGGSPTPTPTPPNPQNSNNLVGSWYFNNGSSLFKLTIESNDNPLNPVGNSYSLDYSLLNGSGGSDFCSISNNALSCQSGDVVVAHPESYAVTLTSKLAGTATYYDQNHMPTINNLLGVWHYHNASSDDTVDCTLTITQDGNNYHLTGDSSDSNGGYIHNDSSSYLLQHDDSRGYYFYISYDEYMTLNADAQHVTQISVTDDYMYCLDPNPTYTK